MAKKDFYEILGVAKSASQKEIKDAYRKLAIKYHPDRNPDNKQAEQSFKECAEAYEVLGDEQKRAQYDRFGHQAFDGSGGGYGGGMNMEDIFRNFGDIFGGGGHNPFDSFFGGGQGGEQRAARGSSIRISMQLTLEEIATGVTKKVSIQRKNTCATCKGDGAADEPNAKTKCTKCNGSGYVRKVQNTFLGTFQTEAVCSFCNGKGQIITKNCKTCSGKGVNAEKETLEIKIPAGVQNGMSLSMRGQGNSGENGGGKGDLLVQIEEIEHTQFLRDNNNIIYNLHLNFAQLVLGEKVDIPTLDGKASIKIQEGTQPGKVLRLSGKGIPDINGYGKGDLLVVVNAWTPQKMNAEEKELMEKMLKMPNFSPDPNAKTKNGFFTKLKDMFS
jgi:molecular chaperone DnaJ